MNQTTMAANPEAGGSALRRAAAAAEAYAPTMLKIGWISLAVSMLGLGMLGFITGDFALNWQPVPAGVPGRTTLAYLTAALSWTLGAGLLIDRYQAYVRHRDRRGVSRVGGSSAWTGRRPRSAQCAALARIHRAPRGRGRRADAGRDPSAGHAIRALEHARRQGLRSARVCRSSACRTGLMRSSRRT